MDHYSGLDAGNLRHAGGALPNHIGASPVDHELLLARRQALSAQEEFAHGRLGVSYSAADLDEARAGAVEARLGEPGDRDTEQLGDLPGVQQGVDFAGLGRGAHGRFLS